MIRKDVWQSIWLVMLMTGVIAVTAPLRATAAEAAEKKKDTKPACCEKNSDCQGKCPGTCSSEDKKCDKSDCKKGACQSCASAKESKCKGASCDKKKSACCDKSSASAKSKGCSKCSSKSGEKKSCASCKEGKSKACATCKKNGKKGACDACKEISAKLAAGKKKSVCCGSCKKAGRKTITGKLVCDGKPIQSGTITFTSKDGTTSTAKVVNGVFVLKNSPGADSITLQVAVKIGKAKSCQKCKNGKCDKASCDKKACKDCKGKCDGKCDAKAKAKCCGKCDGKKCDSKCTKGCKKCPTQGANAKCSGKCDTKAKAKCCGKCDDKKCDNASCDKKACKDCKGKCDGKCDAKAKAKCCGKCDGKKCDKASCDKKACKDCKGKCDGKCDAKAKGKCCGKCDAKAKAKCCGKCDGKKCDSKCTKGCKKCPTQGAKAKCSGKCDKASCGKKACKDCKGKCDGKCDGKKCDSKCTKGCKKCAQGKSASCKACKKGKPCKKCSEAKTKKTAIATAVISQLANHKKNRSNKAKPRTSTKRDASPSSNKNAKSKTKEATKEVRLAYIKVQGGLPESPGAGGIFGDLGKDLRQTLLRLDAAAKDDNIDGVVLHINSPSLGRGRLNEFRSAIHRLRKSGKKVHAYMESAEATSYLLATACSDITIPESGEIMISGIYMEATYYKGLLDKLGITADFLHMGEAKGAAEPMTRKSMSPAVRKNLTALVDDLFDQMLENIAKERKLPLDEVRELVDKAMISATDAHDAGLIDAVAYADELRSDLASKYHVEDVTYVMNYGNKKIDNDFSGTMGLIKLMQAIMGVESPKAGSKAKKIAIVYASGAITSGKSRSDFFGNSSMGSDTIVAALKEAAEDDKVAAIVLRINSPGGSALASDMMWRQTQIVDKPIIASMSDVAASGGYYIAMGCDKIYAEPGTITGSIGVVGGKMALGGLYKKVGLTTSVISRGKNAGLFSGTRVWNRSEREAIQTMMAATYEQFTTKAAKGRKMSHKRLLELASGKVYTGRDAKQLGLVDELGTMKDAITAAKHAAGIGDDEAIELKLLPETPSFFDQIFGGKSDEPYEARLAKARVMQAVAMGASLKSAAGQLPPELVEPLRKAALLRMLFQDRVSLAMPYSLELK